MGEKKLRKQCFFLNDLFSYANIFKFIKFLIILNVSILILIINTLFSLFKDHFIFPFKVEIVFITV